MTLNYSWLAIRGMGPEEVHRLLALHPTGELTSAPDAEFSTADLPGGWHLVFAKRFDFADQGPLAELSAGGELITCCANEPMMYSSISGWRGGARQWYFVHDGGIGIQHMHVEGDPPAEFHEIANRLTVVQAEGAGIAITVDHVFEIPLQTAYALTGFRHEGNANRDDPRYTFERLASVQ